MDQIISAYTINRNALSISNITEEFMNSEQFSDPSTYRFKLIRQTMAYIKIVWKKFNDSQNIDDIFYTRDTNVIRMILKMYQTLHKTGTAEDAFEKIMEHYEENNSEGEYINACKFVKQNYEMGKRILSINLEEIEFIMEGNKIFLMTPGF